MKELEVCCYEYHCSDMKIALYEGRFPINMDNFVYDLDRIFDTRGQWEMRCFESLEKFQEALYPMLNDIINQY